MVWAQFFESWPDYRNIFSFRSKDTQAEVRLFHEDAQQNPHDSIVVLAPNDFPGRFTGDDYDLKSFFEDEADGIRNGVKIHTKISFMWACCMSLGLTSTRFGGEIGIDAGEYVDGLQNLDWTQPGGPTPIGTKY